MLVRVTERRERVLHRTWWHQPITSARFIFSLHRSLAHNLPRESRTRPQFPTCFPKLPCCKLECSERKRMLSGNALSGDSRAGTRSTLAVFCRNAKFCAREGHMYYFTFREWRQSFVASRLLLGSIPQCLRPEKSFPWSWNYACCKSLRLW